MDVQGELYGVEDLGGPYTVRFSPDPESIIVS